MNENMELRSLPAEDLMWSSTLTALSSSNLFSSIDTTDDMESSPLSRRRDTNNADKGLNGNAKRAAVRGITSGDDDGSANTTQNDNNVEGTAKQLRDADSLSGNPSTIIDLNNLFKPTECPVNVHMNNVHPHVQNGTKPTNKVPSVEVTTDKLKHPAIQKDLSDHLETVSHHHGHDYPSHPNHPNRHISRKSKQLPSNPSPMSTDSMKLSQEFDYTPNTSKSIHSDDKCTGISLFDSSKTTLSSSGQMFGRDLNPNFKSQLETSYTLEKAVKPTSVNSAASISPNTNRVSSKTSLFSNNTIQYQTKHSASSSTTTNNNKGKEKRDSLTVPGKGLFYIANSPSPPREDKLDRSTNSIKVVSSDSTNAHIERHDSLFSNYKANGDDASNKQLDKKYNHRKHEPVHSDDDDDYDYTSTDISEDDDFEDYSSEEDHIGNRNDKRRNRLDKNDDNDSEWLSVSSDDEDKCEVRDTEIHPLQFKKIQPRANTDFGSSTATIPLSAELSQKRNSTPILQKPRSLLSGLFLNEMANAKHPPPTYKPILKRSSTTGIITVEQSKPNNTSQPIKRHSILFSKKHNSTTDISKNYPHYHNNLVKENILNDHEGDTDILGKQRSIVGISEYNVMTKSSATKLSEHGKENETIIFTSSSYNETLSSSLSKYSEAVSLSNTSFKNLLSKSSINLTKIYNNSMSRFNKSEISFSEKSSSGSHTNKHINVKQRGLNNKATGSPKSLSPYTASEPISTTLNGLPRTLHHDKLQKFTLSPKTTRQSMLSTELSESLKESIIKDYKLGKVPLPSKVINDPEIVANSILGDFNDDGYDDYHSKGW
jgi:hypothetical protein